MLKTLSPPLMAVLFAVGAQAFLAQAQAPWTLLPGLALAFFVWWKWDPPAPGKDRPLPPLWESLLFSSILLTALFFRCYRLGEIPPGLPADQGSLGLSALKILEGWRPFYEVYHLLVPEPLTPYWLAAWFGLTGQDSLLGLRSFFVLLSLSSFPFIYWYFRQVAGPRAALLALFLLAVMRWDWVMVRNSQPSVAVPFFLFGTLAFLLYGIRSKKIWPLGAAVLLAGTSLYSYQACKVIPLLAGILAFFECRRAARSPITSRHWIALGLSFLLLATPLLVYMVKEGTLGRREAGEFILKKVLEEGSPAPLLSSWTGTALMAHRQGDPSPWYNVNGRRMLDDTTGVLLLLGLGLTWRSRKTPAGFHALAGTLALVLPALLSHVPAASHRLTGLLPFLAFLAARAALGLWEAWPSRGRTARTAVAGCVLALLAAQNAWTYFGLQAKDPSYQEASDQVPVRIGMEILRWDRTHPDRHQYFVDPGLALHPTLLFLTSTEGIRPTPLDLSVLAGTPRPAWGDAVFFVEGNKRGTPLFLADLFPGSSLKTLTDPKGRILSIRVLSPKASLAQAPAWTNGLKGESFLPNEPGLSPPARTTPLLDLSDREDFPVQVWPPGEPFRVRWTGSLEIRREGIYLFQLLTSDQARLWLDGKAVALEQPLPLKAGSHALRLEFEKGENPRPALRFIWKKPGAESWEVVPAGAFGKVPQVSF